MKNSIYRVLNIGVTFLITLSISRLIGVEGYGILSLLIINGAVFNLFSSFGADAGIGYHTAAGRVPRKNIVTVIFFILFFQLVLLSIVETFSTWIYGRYWLIKTSDIGQLWVSYFFLVSISLIEKYAALLNGMQLFTFCNKLIFFSNSFILLAFVGVGIFLPGYDTYNYLVLYVLLYFIQAMSLVIAYHKIDKSGFSIRIPEKGVLRLFSSYSFVTLISNSVQFLAYRIDYWFIDYYRGERELGWYALAVKLVQFLWVLPLLFAGIILSQVAAQNKKFKKERLLSLLRIIFFLNSVAGVILFFCVSWVIPLLFGQEFKESVLPFRILLPGIILFGSATIFAAYFAGNNQLWVNFFASAICLIVILVLDLALIPDQGSKGAAIASCIGYGITTIYYIVKFKIANRNKLQKFFIPESSDWKSFRMAITNSFAKKKT